MPIPEVVKVHVCDVCGEPCIPMADGDRFVTAEGRVVDVVVCMRCDASLGPVAYEVAAYHKP